MTIPGYDRWLEKQADEYWGADEEDCRLDDDYDEDCYQCDGCNGRKKEEYEEARADALYQEMKDRRLGL